MSGNYYLRNVSFVICFFVYLIAFTVAGGFLFFYQGNMNQLLLALIADVIATVVVFVFSTIFKNASLYDPYWSVAPPLIAWYWISTGNQSLATNAMLAVILFWAVRLTLNWARGWKGLVHEDWRYVMLRNKNPKIYWFTNLAGIHLFPTVMVFLGMLPVYFATHYIDPNCSGVCFNPYILLAGFIISTLATIIELLADEQMRAFKKQALPGQFIQQGLWKYSRHPNYFGEISFWFGLFVMQMSVSTEFAFTAVGFIAMLLMFLFASIPMMEEKNRNSKPGYAEYVKRVSVLMPWFRKPE